MSDEADFERDRQRQTTLADLRTAMFLISDPAHWTTGAMARTAPAVDPANVTGVMDDDAACFCATGALRRAIGDSRALGERYDRGYRALSDAIKRRPGDEATWLTVVDVNDHEGHRAVLDLYDRAIAKLREAS